MAIEIWNRYTRIALGCLLALPIATTAFGQEQTQSSAPGIVRADLTTADAEGTPGNDSGIQQTGGEKSYYTHGNTTYKTDDYSVRYVGKSKKRKWWGLKSGCNNSCGKDKHLGALFSPLKCLFGFAIPSGCCGEGCPPAGIYKRVYAYDPYYTHANDRKIYAAQGYGVPVAVPIAPVVKHQYNYSWGLPASRLTPLTNVAHGHVGHGYGHYPY